MMHCRRFSRKIVIPHFGLPYVLIGPFHRQAEGFRVDQFGSIWRWSVNLIGSLAQGTHSFFPIKFFVSLTHNILERLF